MKIKINSLQITKASFFFVTLFGAFIALYAFLYNGIQADKFRVAGIEFEGFYLSLDKKLILKIQSINLSYLQSSQAHTLDIEQQIQYAKSMHLLLQYFQSIEINNIYFQDYNASLLYDGANFILSLPDIYAKLHIQEQDSQILFGIEDLYLSKQGIYFQGNGDFNLKTQSLQLLGAMHFLNPKDFSQKALFPLTITGDTKKITIQATGSQIKNILFLQNLLPIKNQALNDWIFHHYTLSNLELKELSTSFLIGSRNILQDLLHNLSFEIKAYDVALKFHQSLPPLLASEMQIIFKDNTLQFFPQNPSYEQIKLQQSSAQIKEILGKKPAILELQINTNTKLNTPIHKLLAAYDIAIPLSQKSSSTNAKLHLSINLKNHEINYKGTFQTKTSHWKFKQLSFDLDQADIMLDNQMILANINGLTLNTTKLDSHFMLNLQTKEAQGNAFVHHFSLQKDQQDLFKLQNQNLPFKLDFKQDQPINIALPSLSLLASLDQTNQFIFRDLGQISPHAPILKDHPITKGTATITTQDFQTFHANISANIRQDYLFDKAGNTPLEHLDLLLDYSPSLLSLKTKDKRLSYQQSQSQNTISLQNITLKIPKSTNQNQQSFSIAGKKANLIINDHLLLADEFSILSTPKETTLSLQHKNGIAKVSKRGEYLRIDAKEFGDDFLNAIIKKESFHKGRFYLQAQTNEKGVLIGKLNFHNTSINKLNILQNMMAFIDTIPSLLSFKVPGFNNEGYYVQEAQIDFGMNDEYLALEKLNFKGSSMDIIGQGIILLKNQQINLNAKLITIKSLSSLLNKIPIVNYILLGKDGTISTNFKIEGDLDDPRITTQTAQDILLSPFNIFKRILTSPFEIFHTQ